MLGGDEAVCRGKKRRMRSSVKAARGKPGQFGSFEGVAGERQTVERLKKRRALQYTAATYLQCRGAF